MNTPGHHPALPAAHAIAHALKVDPRRRGSLHLAQDLEPPAKAEVAPPASTPPPIATAIKTPHTQPAQS